jgi:hypothetical protein
MYVSECGQTGDRASAVFGHGAEIDLTVKKEVL